MLVFSLPAVIVVVVLKKNSPSYLSVSVLAYLFCGYISPEINFMNRLKSS